MRFSTLLPVIGAVIDRREEEGVDAPEVEPDNEE
jgi:hypothetical protein